MRQRFLIGEKILEILATAGVIGFAALCEGMKDAKWVAGGYTDFRVKRSLTRLQNNDLVVKIKTSAGPKWELTPEGKKRYDQNNLDQIKIIKPELWDGKWRVVIFDIPESAGKSTRDIFRSKLTELGFSMLQKSVFACPWPCTGEILQLSEMLGIQNNVNVLEGNILSDSEKLKSHYNLS